MFSRCTSLFVTLVSYARKMFIQFPPDVISPEKSSIHASSASVTTEKIWEILVVQNQRRKVAAWYSGKKIELFSQYNF
jgi:hypothetical protein